MILDAVWKSSLTSLGGPGRRMKVAPSFWKIVAGAQPVTPGMQVAPSRVWDILRMVGGTSSIGTFLLAARAWRIVPSVVIGFCVKALAASMVLSSCVGPSPPVEMMKVFPRLRASSRVDTIVSTLSPMQVILWTWRPSWVSCSASQKEFVS